MHTFTGLFILIILTFQHLEYLCAMELFFLILYSVSCSLNAVVQMRPIISHLPWLIVKLKVFEI